MRKQQVYIGTVFLLFILFFIGGPDTFSGATTWFLYLAASSIIALPIALFFGKDESKSNEGTLETDNKAFDLTAELAKLDKLKKDGLITAEDYEVLKKRAIEKAKE